MEYTWDFKVILDSFPLLLRGLVVTVELWILAFAIGLSLGFAVSLARISRRPWVNAPAIGYVETFRNTPVLVQLIWFYYAFPIVLGQQLSPFTAAALGLTLNTSAYCAEIFRGGIESIARGQWEGAKAIGMTRAMTMRRVILPQVMKRMLPAFTNRGIELAKVTSLASLLAVNEIMYEGRLLSSTYYRPLEILTVVALVYFFLIYPGSYLSARLSNGDSLRAIKTHSMNDPVIRINNLHKRFGDLHVVKGVDLEIERGERIAIIGASGSGKSTILRCLNFMEMPSEGTIELDGKVLGTERQVNGGRAGRVYSEAELCEVRTRVGMVFQQFNLFPHMTVLENVMEGLITVKRMPKDAARTRATEQLAKVGLQDKLGAYPAKLSGGQQQRVAIARALAMEPDVLLFDEPTSSLDPELVGEVLRVIHALAEEGRTMLLVTHELGFAYHFADRVVFIADGVVHETGTADEVLKHPKRERTQAFLARFTERAF